MKSLMTRSSRPSARILLPLAYLSTAALALAHPGHGRAVGFSAGFEHPLSGWDHTLAMIAVGIWAAQLRARWLIPAAFVAVMAVAAIAGHSLGAVSGIDQAIAASVFILGLLIASAAKLPKIQAVVLVGLFAAFHGFAHGAEMSSSVQGLAYGAGFVVATAALHATGVLLGTLSSRVSVRFSQAAGLAIAAAGVVLALV